MTGPMGMILVVRLDGRNGTFWTAGPRPADPSDQADARFRARTEVRRDGTDPGHGMSSG